jgi:hypothetical protein
MPMASVSAVPNAIWDRDGYHVRKGGTAAGVQPQITWRGLCWAVMQLTFQRARACRVAKRHKARPIAASSARSHHHRNPAPRTDY